MLSQIDPQNSAEMGTATPEGWNLPSHPAINDQYEKLEAAVAQGRTAPDGTVLDSDWVADAAIPPSIPDKIRLLIDSVAIDSTDDPTWAKRRYWKRGPKRGGDPDEQLLRYHEESHDNPDIEQPELPAPAKPSTQIGQRGADGRPIVCIDLEARLWRHSGTDSRDAGYYVGYERHEATATRGFKWNGNPRKLGRRCKVLAYTTGVATAPAGSDIGANCFKALEQSLQTLPNLVDVIADMGISNKKDFYRPAHEANINVVRQHASQIVNHPRTLLIGPKGEIVIDHAGTFLHKWTPKEMLLPPEGLTGDELEDWYADRYKTYAWKLNNGSGWPKQYECPHCRGDVTSDAQTYRTRDHENRTSDRSRPDPKPAGTVPRIEAPEDAEYCCNGLLSIGHPEYDRGQREPYGTPAHTTSYNRRQPVEGSFGTSKNEGSLKKSWNRILGLTAHSIAGVLLAVVKNLRTTRNEQARRRQKAEARAKSTPEPHEDNPAKTGSAQDDQPAGSENPRAPP